ncbi:hypothetical protein KIPB_010484, partial [Kipferlia bialata]
VAANSICGSIVPNVQGILFQSKGFFAAAVNAAVLTVSLSQAPGSDWRLEVSPWLIMALFVFIQVLATISIPSITNRLQEAEGEMRFIHSRSREFCESIAFYRGERQAGEQAEEALQPLIKRQCSLARKAGVASIFTHLSYEIGGTVLPVLTICYLFPTVDVSTYSTLQQELSSMINTLSALLTYAPQVATFFGTLNRVTQLDAQLDALPPLRETAIDTRERVQMDQVDIVSPSRETLVKDVSFGVDKQQGGIVITGPSGT